MYLSKSSSRIKLCLTGLLVHMVEPLSRFRFNDDLILSNSINPEKIFSRYCFGDDCTAGKRETLLPLKSKRLYMHFQVIQYHYYSNFFLDVKNISFWYTVRSFNFVDNVSKDSVLFLPEKCIHL